MQGIPFREVDFPTVDLSIERRSGGDIILTPRQPLEIAVRSVPEGLARQAAAIPDKTCIAERNAADSPWHTLSFAEVKARADAFAQWLLDLDLPPGRPIAILSGNSIAHAIVRLGAMSAGVPVCPVSANYALIGAAGGYARLRHVMQTISPAIIFAETAPFAPAALAMTATGARLITCAPGAFPPSSAHDLADILQTRVTPAVDASIAALDPDAPAAYMLTSGSTGRPKAVIHTQAMIVANLSQGWQTLGRAAGWDDVLLEWLPWSHVSGAFSSMAAMIFGGSFYIDAGKPLPGLFDLTIANLRDIPLRYFTNVPLGYAMLADALDADPVLRATFFRDLRLMLYGGAGLPQPLYDRIQTLAVAETGRRIFFTTGYGATETTSGCMSIYFMTEKVGLGLPMPGLSVKMVPEGDTGAYELRMKGPMVTPGYLGQDAAANAALRDEEGYYRIGDTARFDDPEHPEMGLVFVGRIAEQFKLSTGSWVSGGQLRTDIVRALSPYIADALICGENRAHVAALVWPTQAAIKAGPDVVLPAVRAALAALNAGASGSSERVLRLAFLTEPPNPEAGEVSDKGTINQSLAKARRADAVEALYADPAPPGVIDLAPAHPLTAAPARSE